MKTFRLAIFFLLLLSMQAVLSFAQQKFSIQGRIELATKSKNIYLQGDTIAINPDGTFYHVGTIQQPKRVFLKTDSSQIYAFWLDQGDYVLELKEKPGKAVMLKGSMVTAPIDAKVYDDFDKQAYAGFVDYFPKFVRNEGIGLQQKVVKKYIDSIFEHYPSIKSLPGILLSAHMFMGDSATKSFIPRLTPEMKTDESIQRLSQDLNRQEKIAKEVFFENFTMHTTEGKDFMLSSLKDKKVILIDFWASSCGPCRADHPHLIKMYEKYAEKGLAIVSISLDNNIEAWKKAIYQDKIESFINVSELKGWDSEIIKNYFIYFIPFRFMLDGHRKVIQVLPGSQLPSEGDIAKYLK